MGLNERTGATTEQATPLGKELDVDLFMVFIGMWDPWEVPGILLDRGLINESEFQIIHFV